MGTRLARLPTLCCALALAAATAGCGSMRLLPDPEPTPDDRRSMAAAYVAAGFERDEVPFTLDVKPVAEGRLTSRFGYRRNPTGFRVRAKRHKGVDWAAPAGTPVYAAGDGIVEKLYTSRSYGNYVRIAHANGFSTAYAHLAAFADGLAVGSAVEQGQQIGAVGSTGTATGSHLHFELLRAGSPVDPLFGGV